MVGDVPGEVGAANPTLLWFFAWVQSGPGLAKTRSEVARLGLAALGKPTRIQNKRLGSSVRGWEFPSLGRSEQSSEKWKDEE